MNQNKIDIQINTQPDDSSCGPTSLHAVYKFYGKEFTVKQLIKEVTGVSGGGTIAPNLGVHALNTGFKAKIYAYNLNVFDPTWFHPKALSNEELKRKLKQQLKFKKNPKLVETVNAYHDFIDMGGDVLFKDLNVDLLKHYFSQNIPIIVGLSATYLYRCAREYENAQGVAIYDDLEGEPCGHFVVLCGYDETNRHIIVADPHRQNPISGNNYYKVSVGRLINSIMLGLITYDGNMLIIEPNS